MEAPTGFAPSTLWCPTEIGRPFRLPMPDPIPFPRSRRYVESPPQRDRTLIVIDVAGLLIAGALAVWFALSARMAGGDAGPPLTMLWIGALGYLFARLAGRLHPWGAALILTIGTAIYALSWGIDVYDGPLDGPLGYSNAAGGFFMLSAGLALFVVARASSPVLRGICIALAVAFASVPWRNGAMTPALLLVLIPAALAASTVRATRGVITLTAIAITTSILGTIAIGAFYAPERGVPMWIDATLSERRPELWHDAIDLVARNPLFGVGPMQFPDVSTAAAMDADTIWPHNEFLHIAAEIGLPGMMFFVLLIGWALVRLWHGARDAGTAVAAATFGAITVHATVDYIFHFPAVVALAAVVVGLGTHSESGFLTGSLRIRGD